MAYQAEKETLKMDKTVFDYYVRKIKRLLERANKCTPPHEKIKILNAARNTNAALRNAYYANFILSEDGGDGSGNWGHKGVEGQLGGSAPGGGKKHRFPLENGTYSSYAKMKKDLSHLHKISYKEIDSIPVGSIIVTPSGAKAIKQSDSQFLLARTGKKMTTEVAMEHFELFDSIMVAVPNDSLPEWSKQQETSLQERKDKSPRKESCKEVDSILRDKSGKAYRTLSEKAKEALSYYTANGYIDINEELRTGEKRGNDKLIELITKSIDKMELPDIWLVRGIGADGAAKSFNIAESVIDDIISGKTDPSVLVGLSGKDNAFMSCGSTEGTGLAGDVIYHIFCPEGTKGLYAEPFSSYGEEVDGTYWDGYKKQSNFSSEFETILQRGTQMAITKAYVEPSQNGLAPSLHIECEVKGQSYNH